MRDRDALAADKATLEARLAAMDLERAREQTKNKDLEARMQAERIAAAARLAVAEKDRDMQKGANDAQGGYT